MNKFTLQRVILDNWPAKVLSLVCAFVLFAFHQMSTLEERFFSVPLLVEGTGRMTPASQYQRMIRVTLRGSANSIYPVAEKDIEAYINLGNTEEKGLKRFPVQVRKSRTALDIETLEISVDPMEITLELDRKLSKFITITPKLQGEVAAGFELAAASFNPPRVRIDGPDRLVGRFSELPTELIDIGGRNADFTMITSVISPDQLVVVNENIIEFRGIVRPVMIIKSFTEAPVGVQNLDPRFSCALSPAFSALRLEGPQNELAAWSPDESTLFVDCAGIAQPGEYDVPLRVNLPESFKLLGTPVEASAVAALNRENAEDAAPDGTSQIIRVTVTNADNPAVQ